MIKSLKIQNYALIEDLTIEFSTGLTVITGETGGGKSILLGALGLVLGDRADTKALYDESRKCFVEAVFDIRKYDLQPFFKEEELDYEEELFIRREISPSGKSRAFVNDTPVTLRILDRLSGALIDMHQQFDSLDIHQVSFQLRMIDALAENRPYLEEYRKLYGRYQREKSKLNELEEKNRNSARELEFVNFQLDELEAAQLQEGEQEELEEELSRLSNAEEIKRTLASVYHHLIEDEQSVSSQLDEVGISLGQVAKYDSRLAELDERFDRIKIELEELGKDFEDLGEEIEYDPERIMEVQQRLDQLNRLLNKHQLRSDAELLELKANLEQQKEEFSDLSAEIELLRSSVARNENWLREMALELRQRRQAVTERFENEVKTMLDQLAMEHARLQVEIEPREELGPSGLDVVNFLFAANKGSRLQAIKDVASGGEVSRLTLVTKSLVASAIPLPTLIFDEIDSGISGDVALRMGNILRRLSDEHQVVVITHSPQVASKADAHHFVYKEVREERTVTQVRELDQQERIKEIATMLSQNPPSDSAIQNAKELLSQV
ncbi:MAG: DNA repair protein RecN [Saprospiraceae bacterium]|nr:DNA repair protein RecN [Saprospiraceae bacterium]